MPRMNADRAGREADCPAGGGAGRIVTCRIVALPLSTMYLMLSWPHGCSMTRPQSTARSGPKPGSAVAAGRAARCAIRWRWWKCCSPAR